MLKLSFLFPPPGQSRQIQLHVDDKQFQFLSGGDGRSIKIIHILSGRQWQTQMVSWSTNNMSIQQNA